MSVATDMGAPALEESLREAYVSIATIYGNAAAIAAVGRLLTDPPVTVKPPESPFGGSPFGAVSEATAGSAVSEVASLPKREVPKLVSPPVKSKHAAALARTLTARSNRPNISSIVQHAPPRWAKAIGAVILQNRHAAQSDPWAKRGIEDRPMEHCVRLRYTSDTGEWTTDDVLIRMEDKPFAAGAMRECYAMKKLSTAGSTVIMDWAHSQSCVAKIYKKPASNRAYFTDVLVQMDAKALGDEYNKTNPPKTVDVLQASVLQFPDRKGSPLFCVENLIEGDYLKYNSNSGFVHAGEEIMRHTPQAFSHYTFELTHGYKICVDIQGVGDLYTDPQIHTLDGDAYGEGNLGLKGMALFFRTHECNDLCTRLGLEPLGRCEADMKAQAHARSSSSTKEGSGSKSRLNPSGTMCRTFRRNGSSFIAQYKRRVASDAYVAKPQTKKFLLESLKDGVVPSEERPFALVHLEVARLYSEVVLLPEIRPDEDPEDALRGGLFHLQFAAAKGSVVALCMLARAHLGIDLVATCYSHMIKRAVEDGEFVCYPEVAFRYAKLAADRGVKAAQAAVAHAYATGEGLGEHALEEAQPSIAVKYYKLVLEHPWDEEGVRKGNIFGAEDDEIPDDDSDAAAAAGGPERTVSQLARSISWVSRVSQKSEKEENRKADMDVGSKRIAEVVSVSQLEVSKDFLENIRMAAEEEASALPGGEPQRYEIMAMLGELLKEGGEGLKPDFTAAAVYYTQAAETAETAFKAKLSLRYYELAAECEGMAEE